MTWICKLNTDAIYEGVNLELHSVCLLYDRMKSDLVVYLLLGKFCTKLGIKLFLQEADTGVKLTNGETTSMDFNVMEDTAALTSITKTRVRGPKKKQRPTKSLAITTLDPFEVAAASDRNEQNGTPEPPIPEPEIKPKPKPKSVPNSFIK